ncbi:MAG: hypothetical protein ABI177_14890, partial [Edaphobacter sp.]
QAAPCVDLIFNNQNFFRAHTDLSNFGIDTSLDAHPCSSVSTPASKNYRFSFAFPGKKNISPQGTG